jgi:hypothetical protein
MLLPFCSANSSDWFLHHLVCIMRYFRSLPIVLFLDVVTHCSHLFYEELAFTKYIIPPLAKEWWCIGDICFDGACVVFLTAYETLNPLVAGKHLTSNTINHNITQVGNVKVLAWCDVRSKKKTCEFQIEVIMSSNDGVQLITLVKNISLLLW